MHGPGSCHVRLSGQDKGDNSWSHIRVHIHMFIDLQELVPQGGGKLFHMHVSLAYDPIKVEKCQNAAHYAKFSQIVFFQGREANFLSMGIRIHI